MKQWKKEFSQRLFLATSKMVGGTYCNNIQITLFFYLFSFVLAAIKDEGASLVFEGAESCCEEELKECSSQTLTKRISQKSKKV